jgi:hypothetical protein
LIKVEIIRIVDVIAINFGKKVKMIIFALGTEGHAPAELPQGRNTARVGG